MKYCSACGHPVSMAVPPGDSRERHICDSCRTVHYHNPKLIVGCLPVLEGQVLLCLRSIDPGKGLWTLPSGFLENNETVEMGALRETREEALALVGLTGLHCVYSLPHISQVYMIFLGEIQNHDFGPGDETEEVALFDESQIPWDKLAFSAIHFALEKYFRDTHLGQRSVHLGSREIPLL